MSCENCNHNEFTELGEDGFGNMIYECCNCGSICYENGELLGVIDIE